MEQTRCQQNHGIVMKVDKSKQARVFQIEPGSLHLVELLVNLLDLFELFINSIYVAFVLRVPVKHLHELPETAVLSMSPPGILGCVSINDKGTGTIKELS